MFQTSKIIHPFEFHSSDIPKEFTYPFNYKPHPWVQEAAQEVQKYLETEELNYNFGVDCSTSVGKMFGVLVVEIDANQYGYLAAFSGKINESNELPGFVPPIYDVLNAQGFFKKGEQTLNELNQEIKELQQSNEFDNLHQNLKATKELYDHKIATVKERNKEEKSKRDAERAEIMSFSDTDLKNSKLDELKSQSIEQHYTLKKLKQTANKNIKVAEEEVAAFQCKIESLKNKRKQLSAQLQRQLHASYTFLNYEGKEASLLDIFEAFDRKPPAGAGECAAPRLLNYAYQKNLKPLAMGEFWWGAPPNSEIRQHGNFYPACKSKCEPILSHMLQGLKVEANPVLVPPQSKPLDILFEDEHILVVNKPAGLLSVPGKKVKHCLEHQVIEYLNSDKTPMLVHRLDMSTSGIILIAKEIDSYRNLQRQFTQRTVNKTYTALLDGLISQDNGTIDLPIRVDLDNRPMQLVCYEHGKKAITHFQTIKRYSKEGLTRILFYPITGRTHQLRVHSAHKLGLKTPIKGDELYGKRADRLYLHATELAFDHPISTKRMKIKSPAPF